MNTKWILSAVTLASAAYAMDLNGIGVDAKFAMPVGIESDNSLTIFDAEQGTLTTGTYKWAADNGSFMSAGLSYAVMNENGMNVSVFGAVANTELTYKADSEKDGSRDMKVKTSDVFLGVSASTNIPVGDMVLTASVDFGYKVAELDKGTVEVSTIAELSGFSFNTDVAVQEGNDYDPTVTYYSVDEENNVLEITSIKEDGTNTDITVFANTDDVTLEDTTSANFEDLTVYPEANSWDATAAADKDFENEDVGAMLFCATVGMELQDGLSVGLSYIHYAGDDFDNGEAGDGNVKVTHSANYLGASVSYSMK